MDKYQNLIEKYYEPTGDTVLVAVDFELEKTTESGLVIPLTQENDRLATGQESGTVLAVSKTATYADYTHPSFKPGDRVLFARYAGREIRGEFDKDENPVRLRWMRPDDIFTKFKGKLPDQSKLAMSADKLKFDAAAEEMEAQNRAAYEAAQRSLRGRKDAKTKLTQFVRRIDK